VTRLNVTRLSVTRLNVTMGAEPIALWAGHIRGSSSGNVTGHEWFRSVRTVPIENRPRLMRDRWRDRQPRAQTAVRQSSVIAIVPD
jgi:hypothetical protein